MKELPDIQLPEEKPLQPTTKSNTNYTNELDEFFEYCLNNELPAGISISGDPDSKIKGVDANILKNLAMWLITKNYDLNKVEQTYREKGWNFGDLKGWLKSAQDGNITEINIGEIRLWVKKYLPEKEHAFFNKLDEKYYEVRNSKDEKEPENHLLELKYITNHLPAFEQLNATIGLFGNEYMVAKKIQYYSAIGSLYRTQNFKHKRIEIDSRVHALIVFPSGKGKSNIRGFRKRLATQLGLTYASPSSLHPEQLVGKIIEEKKRVPTEELTKTGKTKFKEIIEYVPNRGYLNSDMLDLDEAKELLTNKDLQISESRKHMRTALDRYGINTVSKKLVNHKPENTLEYVPPVIVNEYTQQQYMYPQEIIFSGDLRRFVICYVSHGTPAKAIYDERLKDVSILESESATKFASFLKKLPPNFYKVIEIDVDDALSEYSTALCEIAHWVGRKAVGFARNLEQTIFERLLQFALLLCIARNDSSVSVGHVKLAYTDLFEMVVSGYRFVEERIEGEFLEGALNSQLSALLLWLEEQGAKSYETSLVEISQFDAELMRLLKVNDRQARRHRQKLGRNGWVDFKQDGQHGSRIWLARGLPDQLQGGQGGRSYKHYNNILSYCVSQDNINYLSMSGTVPPCPPSLVLTPSNNSSMGETLPPCPPSITIPTSPQQVLDLLKRYADSYPAGVQEEFLRTNSSQSIILSECLQYLKSKGSIAQTPSKGWKVV